MTRKQFIDRFVGVGRHNKLWLRQEIALANDMNVRAKANPQRQYCLYVAHLAKIAGIYSLAKSFAKDAYSLKRDYKLPG